MSFPGFDPAFFKFLRALKKHNTREWFADHKATFVRDVETPALDFVRAFEPKLKTISPRFIASTRRVGGSMYRIHRDTRFSADKTPFRSHIGLRFWHDAKGLESRPLFYLHLEPGRTFAGAGLYHPDPVTLRRIRFRITEAPQEWQRVLDSGLELSGDSLTRVPRGFPADHPYAADLKRKSHIVLSTLTIDDVAAPEFLDRFADECHRSTPLMKFLTGAMGLRW